MSRLATGEDYRRKKELEEARKAGLAPAELDEDGKEINPHIPEYMSAAPWYLNSEHASLKHQKDWRDKVDDKKAWYDRGVKVFQATKWRKGACDNCGSMSHTTKDCLERPRTKGAKLTNKNIAADEKVEDLTLVGWDSKRDRWNGYDAKDYVKVVDRFETMDTIRKEMKKKEQVERAYKGQAQTGSDDDEQTDDERLRKEGEGGENDDEKIGDEEDAGFAEVTKRVRTTAGGATGSVRNLRIREDVAKYLLNLDPNSAYYDPKSRSMRQDPNPDKPMDEKQFMGENFVRRNGDYAVWEGLTMHSLEAHAKGQDVHMQANPSLAEMLYKQFKDKKEVLQKQSKTSIVDRYGDAGEKAPEDLLAVQGTERYVEYDRMGRVVKGQEAKARSKYEEDVMVNNHTHVWGSWWGSGVWGYGCRHATVRNSYCTGKAGSHAAVAMGEQMLANMEAKAGEAEASELKKRQESKLNTYEFNKDVWGADDGTAELDPTKVDEAIKRLEERSKAAMSSDKSKRGYNSLENSGSDMVTAEDMEAYRLKKSRGDDPLAAFASKDTILDPEAVAAGKPPAAAGGYDFV
ncbi:MAG: hypothetical protein WDW38_001533 [Sanguina aurantia]